MIFCTSANRVARLPLAKSRAMTAALVAIMLAGIGNGPAKAEDPDISSRRAAERTDFTNDEIRDGFFKIAFSAELQLDAPMQRIRKGGGQPTVARNIADGA